MTSGNFVFRQTRLAPTPSGFLHLGNVLSFILTSGLAQRSGASILLRIDDLDGDRARTEYIQDIFETLRFFDIPWDRGPQDFKQFTEKWSQAHRRQMYSRHLEQLKATNKVFACGCSRLAGRSVDCGCLEKKLALSAADVTWRLRSPGPAQTRLKNIDGTLSELAWPENLSRSVIRRKNGEAAYHVSSVLDDLQYGVDLVVRGEDLLESTVFQCHLAVELGYPEFRDIRFLHHPVVRLDNGLKISKSAGHTSVAYLRRAGKDRSTIFAEMATMVGLEGTCSTWQELFDVLQPLWVR